MFLKYGNGQLVMNQGIIWNIKYEIYFQSICILSPVPLFFS